MATASKVSLATMELDGAGAGISRVFLGTITTSTLVQILDTNMEITQRITTLNQYQQGSLRLVAIPVVVDAIRTAAHSF
jgi:hypothetical protein